jgi:hypothetical protein
MGSTLRGFVPAWLYGLRGGRLAGDRLDDAEGQFRRVGKLVSL